MKRLAIAATAVCLMLTNVPAVEAKGCLKGAAVGAVAGHFLHHHAILGAVAGCAIGHHMAVKREQRKGQPQQHPKPQQGQPHGRHAI